MDSKGPQVRLADDSVRNEEADLINRTRPGALARRRPQTMALQEAKNSAGFSNFSQYTKRINIRAIQIRILGYLSNCRRK